jgi:hypothetical protein
MLSAVVFQTTLTPFRQLPVLRAAWWCSLFEQVVVGADGTALRYTKQMEQ